MIVDAYSGVVWSTLQALGMTEPDSSDVFQIVFLKLTSNLGSLTHPKAIPSWLRTVTRREVQAFLVTKRRTTLTSGDTTIDLIDPDPTPEDQAVAKDGRAAVVAGFRRLSDRCRRLLHLLASDHPPSYTEVSTLLDMPVGAIGPTRRRCLEKLARTPEVSALRTSAAGEDTT